MNIVKGNVEDIKSIMDLIEDNIKDMESKGIFQWNKYYPTEKIFENDIRNETLYIVKNNQKCLGVIVFNEEQSPEYEEINWFTKDVKVLVIHRLAVSPKYQRKGIGRHLLDFAENSAMDRGYTSIRLDAYSGNPRAFKIYESRGYKKDGQIFFPFRELPFYCYEKVLI